jgi:hypothetical protein
LLLFRHCGTPSSDVARSRKDTSPIPRCLRADASDSQIARRACGQFG